MTRFASLLVCTLAATGCEQASNGIGPRGGEVISEDGRLTLVVPEGVMDKTVDVQIARVTDLPEGAIGPAYQLLPVGTAFSRPATLIFELEETQTESYRNLALVSQKNESWFYMADLELNMEDMTLSASALYLTTFAVVGDGIQ